MRDIKLIAALLLGSAGLVRGQQPAGADSIPTPFRSGQWAARFGTGFSLLSLGALKFTSSTRAWLLDADVDGLHREARDGTGVSVEQRATVGLRLGRRAYRSFAGRAVAHHTVGVLGGLEHNRTSTSLGAGGRLDGWTAGLFWEVGADYLVSSNLAVGATADVSASYGHSHATPSSGAAYRAWEVNGHAGLTFVATILF